MSSLKKIEANRRNGAKSKGPITPEGKARSAQNARTHGYTAETVVLSTEQQPIFDRMHQDFTDHYNPLSVVEEPSAIRPGRVTPNEPNGTEQPRLQ